MIGRSCIVGGVGYPRGATLRMKVRICMGVRITSHIEGSPRGFRRGFAAVIQPMKTVNYIDIECCYTNIITDVSYYDRFVFFMVS